jgi:hypothetical protein
MAATSRPARSPSRSAPADLAAGVALFAIVGTMLLLFRHHGGLADADAMVMAAGMAHGLHPDVPLAESLLYGRLVSPGVYAAFHAVYPLVYRDAARTLTFLNHIAWLAGTLSPLALYALYRRRFAPGVAFAGALAFAFTPLVWEAGCSFHPIGPAVLLLFAAVLAYHRIEGSRLGWGWFAIACLCALAGLATRAEIALVAPALLLAAWFSPGRWRALGRVAGITAIAVVGYLALAQTVALVTGEGKGGLGAYAAGYVAQYLRFAVLPRTLVWAAFATGLASGLLALAGLVRVFRGGGAPGARRGVIVALVWALPTLLFWLPNEALVLRHFLLVVPALIWIAAEAFATGIARGRLALATAAVVLANLLVPEAFYAAINAGHPRHPKAPNGTFFSWHAREKTLIDRDRRLSDLVLDAARGTGAFVQVDWRAYGSLLYGMALEPQPFKLESTSSPFSGATVYRYRMAGQDYRLLMVQLPWAIEPGPLQAPTRATLADEIEIARQTGRVVVLPAEVVAAGAAGATGPVLAY